MAFGGTGNDDSRTTPNPAELFDPLTCEVRSVDQPLAGDLFCAGHAFLADGKLLVAGGTHRYDGSLFGRSLPPFSGLEQSYVFDPVSESWTRLPDMSEGRWYPSLIQLGDGRVIAVAGLTKSFPWAFLRRIEVFTPGQGWGELAGADRWMPLYPRLHLLPDGQVFYAGSYNTHYTFPFSLSSFPTALLDPVRQEWTVIGLPKVAEREEGTSILLPLDPPHYAARVLLIGGGKPAGVEATASTEIIDLSLDSPVWQELCTMANKRYYCYGVLLPDRSVIVLGGRHGKGHGHDQPDKTGLMHNGSDSILECESLNVAGSTWAAVAPMEIDRLYHSGAMLLPDGRVMVAGSNPERGVEELRVSIFEPSYLFRGTRPRIKSAPDALIYGTEVEIQTTMTAGIDAVVLIRPVSTTHCYSTDQRFVSLEITGRDAKTGTIGLKIPDNRNLLPPGYYMLFVLRNGIPSVAPFVQIRS